MGLGACMGSPKEVIKEIHVYDKGAGNGAMPAPPASGVGGVDDGGGGNGVAGKPLESYAIDVRQIYEFKEIVVPIILSLKDKFPNLAADLTYIASERSWYLVPVKLNQISSIGIGTYFQTDQMAIQSTNDIWIDSNIYKEMDSISKAKLIVHELLMGVRILEQLSNREKCFASIASESDIEKYKVGRKKCFMDFPQFTSETSAGVRISKDDYALIRKLTNSFFDSSILGELNLEHELTERKFRSY